MAHASSSLAAFHPLIAQWFRTRVGEPTDVQAAAWPKIAAGEHVLVTAPTGSGKTLTAFLWALNALVTGATPPGACRVLYISPLKALNNDIQRNLLTPLAELRQVFTEAGEPFPRIRVVTRSGDTPADERRAMLRQPPEILITTPESLNLMLASKAGQTLFPTVKTVILDEIHAVIDSKRGVHLMSGVERLVRLAGEFQRIALSATVRPPELVAAFVGGYRLLEGERYQPRVLAQVRSQRVKHYALHVRSLEGEADDTGRLSVWPPILKTCREIIAANRATLVFTNTRRLAETLTWMINEHEPELLAYAHHGSLAREIRTEVERRLKDGRLRAIVATNSLELGIDIGALDEVILIQSPPGIASAIQRIGRAGHRVGETSRATLFTTHGQDVLTAAVLAREIPRQNIEAARAVRGPLDVLAQMLVSMTGTETWDIDALFAEVRRSFAFHDLSRRQFDLVLEMLAGRYADTRVRELAARLSIDRLDNTVAARPGALQALYMSGGMIPDRGYYHLRHGESGALVGDLDEECVWETSVGQTLTFGTQNWRVTRITHNDVFATPIASVGNGTPFWKSEELDRSFHFAAQIAAFLEEADGRLQETDYADTLARECAMTPAAAARLIDYLQGMRDFCGCPLPHRHHLVVEQMESGPERAPGRQLVLHTMWGGRVNRPFALALAAAWEARYGESPELFTADNAIYIQVPREISGAEVLSLVTGAQVEALLRGKLESSGYFGARFRECAGRALLLTRRRMKERMPLWLSRMRAKKLLETVGAYPDFPIVLEAWRTCLQDSFDLDALHQVLTELESGEITWSETHTLAPSPFAATMNWRMMNEFVYIDDTPTGRIHSNVSADLLREVVFAPDLRPAIDPAVIARFEAKRRRLAVDYAPTSPRDLLDWVKERLLIPRTEWDALLAAVHRDHGADTDAVVRELGTKLTILTPPGAREALVAATEQVAKVNALWEAAAGPEVGANEPDPAATLAEWLSFYGPVGAPWVAATLGVAPATLAVWLDELLETQRVIRGRLRRDGADDDYCDSENFETLLRLQRAAAVPAFTPRPCAALPLLLARWQGITDPGEGDDALWERLGQLSGYAARAELWEEALLPARLAPYDPGTLDRLLQEGQWHWVGAGKGVVSFCLDDHLPLLRDTAPRADTLLPDAHAHYPLQTLALQSSLRLHELVAALWDGVWAGAISNDAVAALRKGIATGFQAPKLPEVSPAQRAAHRAPRGGFQRWSATAPFAGNWYRLPAPEPPEDRLEEEERTKERVRLLLARYGILFRELLVTEAPALQWSGLFRALRLMELSGEIVTGCFFEGIPGLQFMSHEAFRLLQRAHPPRVWWINACDPASPCGLPLAPLKGTLPRRLPGNWLVYRDTDLLAVVERNGKTLTFHLPPEHPDTVQSLAPLHALLERRVRPELRLTVETINGDPAGTSPYLPLLAAHFDTVKDGGRVFVGRRRG
jgi:ATP-dependent Lhr-like helicase